MLAEVEIIGLLKLSMSFLQKVSFVILIAEDPLLEIANLDIPFTLGYTTVVGELVISILGISLTILFN